MSEHIQPIRSIARPKCHEYSGFFGNTWLKVEIVYPGDGVPGVDMIDIKEWLVIVERQIHRLSQSSTEPSDE